MDTSQVEVNLTTAVDSDDDHEPAHDLNHLACRLRNAVFAKFVSDYLTEKADEVSRASQRTRRTRLRVDVARLRDTHRPHPAEQTLRGHLRSRSSAGERLPNVLLSDRELSFQTAVQLEALAKEQQEVIRACRRDIEALCSSPRRQWRSEEKLSVRLQTKQPTVSSSNWIGVPKTPRCIDRSARELHIGELNKSRFL